MSEHTGDDNTNPVSQQPEPQPEPMSATIQGKPERPTIPEQGGEADIEYRLRVSAPPAPTADAPQERKPLALSLVLDRSGSMSGGKLVTAKYAASAVLDRLDERDLVSVTVFDNQVDLIQPLVAATPEVKESVRAELARIQPRGGTALYAGWQQGAQVLVDAKAKVNDRLAHCFLLTDGQATDGETDPERVAVEVGKVQETGGVGTSTFGIGDDYAEELLGPMSAAGGGQFHHLDEPGEIARMFVAQLGELLSVALPRVRLELDFPQGAKARVVSAYWAHPGVENDGRVTTVGDLLAGEQRSIVFAVTFPAGKVGDEVKVRARLVWAIEKGEQSSPWDEVTLTYATMETYMATPMARSVSSRALAERARYSSFSAMSAYKTGHGLAAQIRSVDDMIDMLSLSAHDDPELQSELDELIELRQRLQNGTATSRDLKRSYSSRMFMSRRSAPRLDDAWTTPANKPAEPPLTTPQPGGQPNTPKPNNPDGKGTPNGPEQP